MEILINPSRWKILFCTNPNTTYLWFLLTNEIVYRLLCENELIFYTRKLHPLIMGMFWKQMCGILQYSTVNKGGLYWVSDNFHFDCLETSQNTVVKKMHKSQAIPSTIPCECTYEYWKQMYCSSAKQWPCSNKNCTPNILCSCYHSLIMLFSIYVVSCFSLELSTNFFFFFTWFRFHFNQCMKTKH